MKKKQALRRLLLVAVVILTIVLLMSCKGYEVSYDDSYNRIFTLKRGIGHFSMEIPNRYVLEKVYRDYTDVYFAGPISEDRLGSGIWVSITNKNNLYPDIETYVRESMSLPRSWSDFKLLGESTVEVASTHGYHYTFSYVEYYAPIMNKPPATVYAQEIYFEQCGLYWNITVRSGKSELELANEALEQVLRTFKVLN